MSEAQQVVKPAAATRMWNTVKVYLEPRVLTILFLGFSAGLPLALSGSTLLFWMAEAGVDIKAIGLFSLVGTPYTIKFFWAPIVDALNVLDHRNMTNISDVERYEVEGDPDGQWNIPDQANLVAAINQVSSIWSPPRRIMFGIDLRY